MYFSPQLSVIDASVTVNASRLYVIRSHCLSHVNQTASPLVCTPASSHNTAVKTLWRHS
ncbi:hypothetical protein Mapa_001334 [Marchantia paleacea]|nr:hypothetical protein Mapa_001334 [Marchantia paleacea]